MSENERIKTDVMDAVDDAVRDLVCVKRWGDTAYVTLPIIGPDGSSVTVRIVPAAGGFRVDDAGFAYHDLERVGAERSFGKVSTSIADVYGLDVTKRSLLATVTQEELSRAICDVGIASWTVTNKVYERISHDETEIEEFLKPRLEKIFGANKIDSANKITGSSTREWEVSAIVHLDSRTAIFQAVGMHSNSVFRTSAAFHDLRVLPNAPTLISVVKDRAGMGTNLSILAQAGRVIQGDQPDEVYLRAAA